MTDPLNQEHEDVLNFAHSLPSGLTKEQIYVRIHERARAIPPAAAAAGLPAGLVPKWAGQFDTFDDWVRRAQRVLSVPAHKPGAICVDAKGRRCHIGADMARARDEGAFPVRYFWECEVAALPADPVGESQPAALTETQQYRAGYGDGVRRAAKLCDAKYQLRSLTGQPREASAARALAEEIRSLQSTAPVVAPVPAAQEGQGWTKNTGARPVADGVLVQVEVRDGPTMRRDAGRLDWSIEGVQGDIVRWRLAPAMEAPSHE